MVKLIQLPDLMPFLHMLYNLPETRFHRFVRSLKPVKIDARSSHSCIFYEP